MDARFLSYRLWLRAALLRQQWVSITMSTICVYMYVCAAAVPARQLRFAESTMPH